MLVFYADDDEDREIFAEMLKRIDPTITIVEAEDGIETIIKLANLDLPDIIFLDINMPKLNGYETLMQIRKDVRLKDAKVIMYSTAVNQNRFSEHSNLNATFLLKPNTFTEGLSNLGNIFGNGSVPVSR
jgi:CheY-like chemotaxis protein